MTREEKNAKVREWRRNNPDRVKLANEKWRAAHPGYFAKASHLRRLKKYGLDEEAVQRLLDAQCGKCAICGSDSPGKTGWHVDHDHKTQKVRGLLCMHCNLVLGHARDSVERLEAAIAYLKRQSSR